MSASLAAYGLRPVFHPSGQDRALGSYQLASGYATALYRGTPVVLNPSTQQLNVAANGADWLGVFWGVEYTDVLGVPQESPYWPASQVATNIVAWVYSDPAAVFEIQADGSVALGAVGQQINFSGTAGSTVTDGSTTVYQSTTAAGAASLTNSGQGMMRIVDFGRGIDNAAGDAFTVLRVTIARHQFISNKVAV